MSRPETAREALIAELIGDVGALLTRIESLSSTMDQAREALTDAAGGLIASVEPFRTQVDAISARAKAMAVEHIARRANEMASQSLVTQKQAMAQAARAMLSQEIAPAVQQLIVSLGRAAEGSTRPYEAWLTHAATAVLSAAGSAWLVYLLMGR